MVEEWQDFNEKRKEQRRIKKEKLQKEKEKNIAAGLHEEDETFEKDKAGYEDRKLDKR